MDTLNDLFQNLLATTPTNKLVLASLILATSFKMLSLVRFIVRSFLLFCIIIISSIIGMAVSIIFYFLGWTDSVNHVVGRVYTFLSTLLLQQKYNILNPEALEKLNGRPVVFVGNHQSSLDLCYLGTIFPPHCVIMVKKSLSLIPVFGWYLRLSGTIFIDRKNRTKALATTSDLSKAMTTKNVSVFLYCEGTRSGLETPGLLPFKKGAFHLAVETGFPIVPIVFSNTSHLFSTKKWIFESGSMNIEILEPVETKGKTKEDVNTLIDQVFNQMQQSIKKISTK